MESIAAEKIAGQFLEWDLIEDEKAKLAERSKALFKAMKDDGYDTKAARVAFREKRAELIASPDDVSKAEAEEAMLDLYRAALTNGLRSRARPAHTREGQSYAEAKGIDTRISAEANAAIHTVRAPVDPSIVVGRELTDTQEQPETANDLNNGEDHDGNSRQRIGRPDGEQRGPAPVQGADGCGKSADDGDQGQGAGSSGTDRLVGTIAGELDRQDQDGRGRHVGGEVDHEITQSDDGAFSEVKGRARPENAAGVEPPSSETPSTAVAAVEPEADTPSLPAASGDLSNDGIPAFLLKDHKPLRPNCLNPENCAGYGSYTCHRCTRAMAESEAA